MSPAEGAGVPAGLGLITKGESLELVLQWLELAARTGFHEVQLQICWHPIGEDELALIARRLRELELHCRSVGVYNDLLRPDSYHFFNTSGRELEQVIRWMPSAGLRDVVVWSGSRAEGLLDDDPRNHGSEARALLEDNARKLLPLLERTGTRLLFEPWRTHVLAAAVELAAFCRIAPESFGVVLDVANFIDPAEWTKRRETIQSTVDVLGRFSRIVHLKDMTVDDGGGFELPYAGKGQIDYDELLGEIRPMWRRVPFVIEHVGTEGEIREAAHFVVAKLAAAGYPLD